MAPPSSARLRNVAIVALLAFGAGACGGDESSDNPGTDACGATCPDTAGDAGGGGPDAAFDDADAVPLEDVGSDVPPDGSGAVIEQPLTLPLEPDGPWVAGYRSFEHTYTPAGQSTPRTIVIHLWYPATEETSRTPRYLGLFPDKDVFVDAPLAPSPWSDGRYPLHAHSHGSQGHGGTSADLLRHFATHGWVVVAPDHTGNTLTGNLEPRPLAMYALRSLDMRESIDRVEQLPAGDPLSGRVDTSRVVLSGHSYGVHTVWASTGATFDAAWIRARCAEGAWPDCDASVVSVFDGSLADPRIVAAIPMAGSISRDFFGTEGHSTVTVPMLAMSGTKDPVGAESQFETTDGVPMTWIDLEGGCHQTFALGGCGTLPDAEGFAIVRTWALAFSRFHVVGDRSEETTTLLDGTRNPWSGVAVRRRE